jgi:3-deoxy-D-manno-octulosonic-acid transferase
LAPAQARGVPVVLASARMSERSALGYRKWSAVVRPAFSSLAAACAQSDADASRLAELGAKKRFGLRESQVRHRAGRSAIRGRTRVESVAWTTGRAACEHA